MIKQIKERMKLIINMNFEKKRKEKKKIKYSMKFLK
jgi:hypothetical protein